MTGIVQLEGRRVRLTPRPTADRGAAVAIRSTDEVRRWWRGRTTAEFDADLADDDLHQLTIEDGDGRSSELVQFGEEDDPTTAASIDIYVDLTPPTAGASPPMRSRRSPPTCSPSRGTTAA
ncbi:MAG: hypothetical protein R2705_09510 [Ilumatobacteraceae bacterium]